MLESQEKAKSLSEKYITLLNKYEVNTPLRLAHFFGQMYEESHLTPISENLNYKAPRLVEIFPKNFKTLDEAKKYAGNPQAIANKIYANRMSNGNEASGDGWKYRGRGFIQITGKQNYTNLSTDTKIDYLKEPDKLLTEADSMISALWYWKKANCNANADLDDVRGVTKKINGGYINLDARIQHVNEMKEIFK